MKMRNAVVPLLLTLCVTAGCFRFVPPESLTPQSGSLVQFVTPEPATASPLMQAMAFLPVDVDGETLSLSFTDWTLIKAYEGAEDITSRNSEDEKVDFLLTLNRTQAAFSAYGISKVISGHAEVWGWDTTDPVWEAQVSMGPPLWVLKFPDGFDFTPIVQRFEERGFTRNEHQGVAVYSHPMDFTQDWLRVGEFAILNTAVLAAEGVLILSSISDGVYAALDAYYGDDVLSYADIEPVRTTAQQMGEVATAYLDLDACAGLALNSVLDSLLRGGTETLEELKERLLRGHESLRPYLALGVGYRYEDNEPVGLVLMHYADATSAQADSAARLQIAQEGDSLRTGQPFRETVIAVTEAAVEGSTLILRGRPADDMPNRLVHMVFARDMAFAACP